MNCLLLFIAPILLSSAVFAQTNLDFEGAASLGTQYDSTGWVTWDFKMRSYQASLSNHKPYNGKQCLKIASTNDTLSVFGVAWQKINPAALRGKRVAYKAFVRVESDSGAFARLWMRVDRPQEQKGFFDNMDDRRITSSEWSEYTITGRVDGDAVILYIGGLFEGHGSMYVDDVTFTILPEE